MKKTTKQLVLKNLKVGDKVYGIPSNKKTYNWGAYRNPSERFSITELTVTEAGPSKYDPNFYVVMAENQNSNRRVRICSSNRFFTNKADAVRALEKRLVEYLSFTAKEIVDVKEAFNKINQ